MGERREAGHAHQRRRAWVRTHKAEHVVAGVVGVDPREALRILVVCPQSGGLTVDPVQVARQVVDTPVVRVLQQPPVKLSRLGPLGLLGQLASHEDQLLAGVRPHERKVGTQVRELLPAVAGHLAEQRPLAVHDLIVRDREHVVLCVRVHHRERHLVVMELTVHRVVGDVVQRVVHPAHVPLEPEAQPAQMRRPRHSRPVSGLLRDRDGSGHPPIAGGVHLLEELRGLQVLASPVDVRSPPALLA